MSLVIVTQYIDNTNDLANICVSIMESHEMCAFLFTAQLSVFNFCYFSDRNSLIVEKTVLLSYLKPGLKLNLGSTENTSTISQ